MLCDEPEERYIGTMIVSERFLEGGIQIHKHPIDETAQMQYIRVNLVKDPVSIVNGFWHQIDGFRYNVIWKLFSQVRTQHIAWLSII